MFSFGDEGLGDTVVDITTEVGLFGACSLKMAACGGSLDFPQPRTLFGILDPLSFNQIIGVFLARGVYGNLDKAKINTQIFFQIFFMVPGGGVWNVDGLHQIEIPAGVHQISFALEERHFGGIVNDRGNLQAFRRESLQGDDVLFAVGEDTRVVADGRMLLELAEGDVSALVPGLREFRLVGVSDSGKDRNGEL